MYDDSLSGLTFLVKSGIMQLFHKKNSPFFKPKGGLRDHNIHLILNPKGHKSSEVDFILFQFSLLVILILQFLSSILISCNIA
jgi:hypothetical protein